jgi:hypothetical protein
MTIFDGAASLCIYSDTHLASAVSDVLGLTPDTVGEVGDPKAPVRFDAEGVAQRQYFYKQATWILDVSADDARDSAADDDTAGLQSILVLAERLAGKELALASLRPHYETIIRWYGVSGSSQGGFVMPIGLIERLAKLGCNLFGNLYSYVEDDGDDQEHLETAD